MATQVLIMEDSLSTTTMAAVLRDMRDLVDLVLAGNVELLKDFPSGHSGHAILAQALEVLRVTAGSISLDELLERNRKAAFGLPVARPGGDGTRIIDIRGDNDSSMDRLLSHTVGRA
jgi:hypothetical protein